MKKHLVFIFISVILLIVSLNINYHNINDENNIDSDENQPSNSGKHNGIAISLFDSNNSDSWYDNTLPKIKNLGGEMQVVTAVTVQNENDSLPVNDLKNYEKLHRLFEKSKQYGVPVSLLKPHLMLPNFDDNLDRGSYKPSDINLFFKSWKEILLYYAFISSENGVPILSISTETSILTQYKYVYKWNEIIQEIRAKYPQLKITMSFKKSELDRELKYHEQGIKSVSTLLDYISVNMYPKVKRLNGNATGTNDEIFIVRPDSYGYIEAIQKANKYFNKDIIITETGATPKSDKSKDYIDPRAFVYDTTKQNDYVDQNEWMKTVLGAFLIMEEVKGVYIWHVNPPFDFLDSPTAETIKEFYKKY